MSERRQWPRMAISGGMKIELRLQVSGTHPAVLLTPGVARDISCGGVSCAVDLAVPKGTQVSVRFSDLPHGASVVPETVPGRVVRTEPMGEIPGRVAIAFAEPLNHLDLNRQAQIGEPSTDPDPDTSVEGGFGCATTFGRVFR